MIFLKYKQPRAEHVQFQRFISGMILLAMVLFQEIELGYVFLILSIISFVTTINYSPTTFVFRLLSLVLGRSLFVTAPQYAHSYVINRLAEVFEDILRISGGIAIIYLHTLSPLASWMLASFMSIAMLISGIFGFCLSSLVYIAYQRILKKKGSADE